MPRVVLGDVTVHYQQMGKGADLVLIHGLYCNLAFWYLTVAPKLAENFRVTVYDLRGHGLSQRMAAGYRAIDLADDLRLLLVHLGMESAHVVGHSFGGAVALAFALSNPKQVRSLTLADAWIPTLQPVPLANAARWPRLQARLRQHGIAVDDPLPRVAHGFLEELLALREADATRDATTAGEAAGAAIERAADAAATQTIDAIFSTGPDSMAMRRWRQLVRTTSAVEDFSDGTGIAVPEIRTLQRPTSVIFGRQSRYLPSMRGLRRNLPECRVTLVPNAGHYFPVLKPHVFTHAVTSFAAQHG
jgi:pimeloyl-ACP methyl ester carboxylesterase